MIIIILKSKVLISTSNMLSELFCHLIFPLQPEPCQSTYRYHIIINRNRVFEAEKFAIAADVCIDLVCSTEFQIRSVSQQSEDFSVSIKSGDISNRHNGRLLSFSDTFSEYQLLCS